MKSRFKPARSGEGSRGGAPGRVWDGSPNAFLKRAAIKKKSSQGAKRYLTVYFRKARIV